MSKTYEGKKEYMIQPRVKTRSVYGMTKGEGKEEKWQKTTTPNP